MPRVSSPMADVPGRQLAQRRDLRRRRGGVLAPDRLARARPRPAARRRSAPSRSRAGAPPLPGAAPASPATAVAAARLLARFRVACLPQRRARRVHRAPEAGQPRRLGGGRRRPHRRRRHGDSRVVRRRRRDRVVSAWPSWWSAAAVVFGGGGVGRLGGGGFGRMFEASTRLLVASPLQAAMSPARSSALSSCFTSSSRSARSRSVLRLLVAALACRRSRPGRSRG